MKKKLPDKKADKECEQSLLRFAKEAKKQIEKWEKEERRLTHEERR